MRVSAWGDVNWYVRKLMMRKSGLDPRSVKNFDWGLHVGGVHFVGVDLEPLWMGWDMSTERISK
jgi:hypothetical protein